MNARLAPPVAFRTLDHLQPGDYAVILAVNVSGALQPRLVALGLIAGRRVQVLRRAPFGGPLHVRLGMTEIMLRAADAACIQLAD